MEPDSMGFTNQDRKTLITLEIHIERVLRDMKELENRMTSFENNKITDRDLKPILDHVIDLDLRHNVMVNRMDNFDKWRWKVVGGGIVVLSLLQVAVKIFGSFIKG